MAPELVRQAAGPGRDDLAQGAPLPRLAFRTAAETLPGRRAGRQDAGSAAERLLAVASGIGDEAGGGIAAYLVVDHLVHRTPTGTGDVRSWRRTVAAADARIRAAGRLRADLRGLATTLTAVALGNGTDAVVVHIGDSRAYLRRAGVVQHLERDAAQEQAPGAQRSARSAALRGGGDVVGTSSTTVVDLRPGDRLLLCTDGLTGCLSEGLVAEILGEESTASAVVERLLGAVRTAAPQGDATAVVADVVTVGPPVQVR